MIVTYYYNLLLSAVLLVVLQVGVLHVGVLMPRVVVVALQHVVHPVLRARVSPAEWWTVDPGPGGRDGGTLIQSKELGLAATSPGQRCGCCQVPA